MYPVFGTFPDRTYNLSDIDKDDLAKDTISELLGSVPTRDTTLLFTAEFEGLDYTVTFEKGTSVTYGLYNAQERGELFIGAARQVGTENCLQLKLIMMEMMIKLLVLN